MAHLFALLAPFVLNASASTIEFFVLLRGSPEVLSRTNQVSYSLSFRNPDGVGDMATGIFTSTEIRAGVRQENIEQEDGFSPVDCRQVWRLNVTGLTRPVALDMTQSLLCRFECTGQTALLESPYTIPVFKLDVRRSAFDRITATQLDYTATVVASRPYTELLKGRIKKTAAPKVVTRSVLTGEELEYSVRLVWTLKNGKKKIETIGPTSLATILVN